MRTAVRANNTPYTDPITAAHINRVPNALELDQLNLAQRIQNLIGVSPSWYWDGQAGYVAGTAYCPLPLSGAGDLTVSRASDVGTRVNPSGVIETVPANTPRIDFDPITGAYRGVLIEPSRTHALLNNTSTPALGGWNIQNVGLFRGTPIIRYTKTTASASHSRSIPISPLPAENSWVTIRFRLRAVEGSPATTHIGVLGVDNSTSNVWGLSANSTISITEGVGSTTRLDGAFFAVTGLSTSSFTEVVIRRFFTSVPSSCSVQMYGTSSSPSTNQSVDMTMLQGELGDGATSWVEVGGSAITRNADNISKTGVADLIGQTEGTIYAEFWVESGSSIRGIISLGEGTTYRALSISGANGLTFRGGATIPITSFGFQKAAGRYTNNFTLLSTCLNGSAIANTSGAATGVHDRIHLGANDTGLTQRLQNALSRAAIFPVALTDQQLQLLTTL
jgi:hypothetical protein